MNARHPLIVLILLVLIGFTGCGEDNEAPTGAQTAPASSEASTPASTAQPRAATTASDEAVEFTRLAAIGGLFEMQSAQLILDKNIGGDETAFAELMIADHGKVNEELAALARSKEITLPTTLDSEHQEKLDKLKGLSGEALAEEYHEMQQEAHEAAVALFENAAQNLQDAELKAWAARTLPLLKSHQQKLGAHHHHH